MYCMHEPEYSRCWHSNRYDVTKHFLMTTSISEIRLKDGLGLQLIASSMAGLVATSEHKTLEDDAWTHGLALLAICSPADVIKSRIMAKEVRGFLPSLSPSNADQLLQKGSIADVVRTSLRKEGPQFLFKGWTPAFIRLAPSTILLFVFLEVSLEVLGQRQ